MSADRSTAVTTVNNVDIDLGDLSAFVDQMLELRQTVALAVFIYDLNISEGGPVDSTTIYFGAQMAPLLRGTDLDPNNRTGVVNSGYRSELV
ncbi:MAG: hypothetical protein R3D02_10925 [Hyphomicrobiales bacterium]